MAYTTLDMSSDTIGGKTLPPHTPTFKTERLKLRPVTLDDVPTVQREFSRWEIIRYMDSVVPWPYPDDGAQFFYEKVMMPAIAAQRKMAWAIELLAEQLEAQPRGNQPGDEDTLIGVINISTSDKESGNRGFWLAHRYWRNGYMSEAAHCITDYALRTLNWPDMIIDNAVENTRSGEVKARHNFELLGEMPGEAVCGPVLKQRWRMTRENWLKQHPKPNYILSPS